MLSTIAGILVPNRDNWNRCTAALDWCAFVTMLAIGIIGLLTGPEHMTFAYSIMTGAGFVGLILLGFKKITPATQTVYQFSKKRPED